MSGKGFFFGLKLLDDLGRYERHTQKAVLEWLKMELAGKYNAYYFAVTGQVAYTRLENSVGTDEWRAEKLCLTMRELRLEIEERIKDLNTAVSSKKSVVINIGKQALIKGGKAAVQDAALAIVKGTFTGGVSLAVDAVKAVAPGLTNMAGHATASKKNMVDYYLGRGAHDFALVYAMGHAMINEAWDLQIEGRDSHLLKFKKPQKTAFWNKDTTVWNEQDKLDKVLTSYKGLVDGILEGESNNSEYVGLMFGQQRSDQY